MSHVVTVPELLDGHTVLDIECLDRVYLSGYVPTLQVGGQVFTFLHDHRGMPVASPAVFGQISGRFRQAVDRFAQMDDIPVVKFKKGVRKLDVMQRYLRAAARADRPGVAAIGRAEEFQLVWDARQRDSDPSRPPVPLTAADQAAGYWWELSMRQVETSRTLVFDAPRQARAFFEALIADNLDLGRPEHVEILFKRDPRGRKPKDQAGGRFRTAIDRNSQGVTINAFWRHSRVKQYLKDGRALRIETVVNSPDDLGCQRRLHNLPELQARARAINARLLETERVGQGCVFDSPAFARISQPTFTQDGRRAPGLRFGDPRVMALAGTLASTLTAVTGITNKSLRAFMTSLLGTAYSVNQASYDLTRLSRNGIITRIPHRNLYPLTGAGLPSAIFYHKVPHRVLRPLLAAHQPHPPPPLRRALPPIHHEVTPPLAPARP